MAEVTERILELERRRSVAHMKFVQLLDEGHAQLLREVDAIEEELRQLVSLSGPLPVLIRCTPGPEVTVYHSETHPCRRVSGRGRHRTSFQRTTEQQALIRGLTRCTACNWATHEREAAEAHA